jgi:hypothetical protein
MEQPGQLALPEQTGLMVQQGQAELMVRLDQPVQPEPLELARQAQQARKAQLAQ